MNVFEKLGAVEDEIFQEMERIDKEIDELRRKQRKLKDLGKSMNPERFTKIKSKQTKWFLKPG